MYLFVRLLPLGRVTAWGLLVGDHVQLWYMRELPTHKKAIARILKSALKQDIALKLNTIKSLYIDAGI